MKDGGETRIDPGEGGETDDRYGMHEVRLLLLCSLQADSKNAPRERDTCGATRNNTLFITILCQ